MTTTHPESQDGRKRPTIPAGTMRRYWCITRSTASAKESGRMLCYGNAYVMPLSDNGGEAPDDAVPVGDDGYYAWTGWYEESCEQCDTYWAFHGEVLAWLELPQTVEAFNAHAALSERVRELEGALAPFAALADLSSIKACDNEAEPFMTAAEPHHVLLGIRKTILTVGDIRAARQALTAQRSEP